jgi:hypothetical protein
MFSWTNFLRCVKSHNSANLSIRLDFNLRQPVYGKLQSHTRCWVKAFRILGVEVIWEWWVIWIFCSKSLNIFVADDFTKIPVRCRSWHCMWVQSFTVCFLGVIDTSCLRHGLPSVHFILGSRSTCYMHFTALLMSLDTQFGSFHNPSNIRWKGTSNSAVFFVYVHFFPLRSKYCTKQHVFQYPLSKFFA